MTRERFYDERDFEDGAVPGDDYQYDPEDDLPDGSIPRNELPTLEDELRRLADLPKKSIWNWRFD